MAASLFFYTWGEGKLVAVMLTTIVIDYFVAVTVAGGWKNRKTPIQPLDPRLPRTKKQRWILTLSVCANLGMLGFFKYFNFGVENFNAVMDLFGFSQAAWRTAMTITLPLGISFYTFQSMSYTIDVYRGRVAAARNPLQFMTLVTMFPHLIAGPIIRYANIAIQITQRTFTQEKFVSGIQRFSVGLAKKMLVANIVAVPADKLFTFPASDLSAPLAWVGIISYALQIYFDFSGYSDMAIGLGRMLGFEFLENFNYPYISRSIREFWRRWHISLSSWFRDYLYIPLGGSRRSAPRTYLNLLIVFFITGLWHGASWSFVVWGLFHGVFMMLERTIVGRWLDKAWRPIQHVYVLLIVLIGWVFFRTNSLESAIAYLRSMVGMGSGAVGDISQYMDPYFLVVVVIGIVGSAPILKWCQRVIGHYVMTASNGRALAIHISTHVVTILMVIALLGASLMLMAHDTYNPFIYFRF
ncbi:MAG: MBOAT family O-acyltransferase [Parcubacteria group bacterium]